MPQQSSEKPTLDYASCVSGVSQAHYSRLRLGVISLTVAVLAPVPAFGSGEAVNAGIVSRVSADVAFKLAVLLPYVAWRSG